MQPVIQQKAVKLAEIESCLSHWSEGIWGAQAVAASIAVAMVSDDIDEIIKAALMLFLRYLV